MIKWGCKTLQSVIKTVMKHIMLKEKYCWGYNILHSVILVGAGCSDYHNKSQEFCGEVRGGRGKKALDE